MLDNLKKYKVILASNSPRRRELLGGLGIDFEIKALSNVDESYPDTLDKRAVAKYIAQQKANSYKDLIGEDELLITADTTVVVDNQVLGKPKDKEDAMRMLKLLSGVSHQVITGVCILTTKSEALFDALTEVSFAELSDQEIEYYIDRYSPYDKAGAYGIQEWIGFIGVTSISGSYYNVMGLPIQKLYRELLTID